MRHSEVLEAEDKRAAYQERARERKRIIKALEACLGQLNGTHDKNGDVTGKSSDFEEMYLAITDAIEPNFPLDHDKIVDSLKGKSKEQLIVLVTQTITRLENMSADLYTGLERGTAQDSAVEGDTES